MNVSRASPPRAGGWSHPSRRPIQTAFAVVVLLGLVLGGLFVLPTSHAPSSAASAALPASTARSPSAQASPAVLTHGDLIVTNGQTYTIQPTVPASTYYQGGNITVEKGGTLIITGVTLSFVQFVTPTGTAAQRLAHIYHFTDAGNVFVTNSVITTDLIGVNVYAKLNLAITGNMTLLRSSMEFPGWVTVSGGNASLTLNSSKIERNPAVQGLSEWPLIKNDTNYAPDITVSAGAAFNLFASNVTNLYADNFSANGVPRPAPLSATNVFVGAQNLTGLATPSDNANLTRDWLYYTGVSGGAVTFNFSNPVATQETAQVTVWYGGVSYPLGTVTFPGSASNAFVSVPFSSALTNAINAAGLLTYLNYTGAFGVTPSKISIQISSVVGTPVNASLVQFVLNPPVSNNIAVTGTGSAISTVDSSLNLTFNDTPASALSLNAPYPWLSNKLVLSGGAVGYLANLTLENKILHVFNTSAILVDSTSFAYLYRWAEFAMMGRGGYLPVYKGSVSTFYAYDNIQANNNTANTLNKFQTADPAIWGYLQYYDVQHAYPSYAMSGSSGVAAVLLLANEINSSSLPNGYFLGGYHIFETIPAPSANVQQFNWTVSAYPIGSAVGTPGYAMPDTAPQTTFSSYYAAVTISGAATYVGGSLATSVKIGETLTVRLTLHDNGTAPITSAIGALYYNRSLGTLLAYNSSPLSLDTLGQNAPFNLTWQVNDSVSPQNGTYTNTFAVTIQWNTGIPITGGGATNSTVAIVIEPSNVRVTGAAPTFPSSLLPNHIYSATGRVYYNGTQVATVVLLSAPAGTAAGTSGWTEIASTVAGPSVNGSAAFTIYWNTSFLTEGKSYSFEVRAYYNGVSNTSATLPGTYEVPSTVPPTNILNTKFLGLDLWLWIVIAAAILAGIYGALLLLKRQAAGKLVECGECGNLIPEDARVCPKCGAEFESDVVRCSRCASTIPANSKFCPECAAQLLGKPEDTAADPDRQAYNDFTERFRAEGRKELGENYTEGAFWDWWKRQPSYTPYSQWRLQQSQGAPRPGMAAPPAASSSEYLPTGSRRPPSQGRGGGGPAGPSDTSPMASAGPRGPTEAAAAPAAPGAMKPCPSCSREIPSEYLVCPFCGSVTQ